MKLETDMTFKKAFLYVMLYSPTWYFIICNWVFFYFYDIPRAAKIYIAVLQLSVIVNWAIRSLAIIEIKRKIEDIQERINK